MPLTVQALDHLVVQSPTSRSRPDGRARAWHDARGCFASAGPAAADRDEIRPTEDQPPPIATSKEDWFTADHEAAGSEDLCFLTDSSPDEVVRHLQAQGVAIVAGPGPRRGAQGTLMSVYCRDPDGALIEIASYLDG